MEVLQRYTHLASRTNILSDIWSLDLLKSRIRAFGRLNYRIILHFNGRIDISTVDYCKHYLTVSRPCETI